MSDSESEKKCVFCAQKTFEKTISFTADTLKKCLVILEYRKTKPIKRKSRSNYNEVNLFHETSLSEVYHAQCYKLFTAIKVPTEFKKAGATESNIVQEDSGKNSEFPIPTSTTSEIFNTSAEQSLPSTSTTNLFADTSTDETEISSNINNEDDPDINNESFHADKVNSDENLPLQVCFICEKSRKRRKGREIPLAVNRQKTIDILKSAATEHNDIEMLEKISLYSDDSSILYHICCKDQYLRDLSKGDESEFVQKRKATNTAFALLCEMLQEYIVKNNECLFFDHVKKQYFSLLTEQSKLLSDSISISSFSDRHLEKKIAETFAKQIKIIYAEKKKFLAPFAANIVTYNDLFKNMTMKETIRSVALRLREEVRDSVKTKMPEDCTAEDLIRSECDYVPELLTCFLETFILGDVTHLSRQSREKKKDNYELSLFSLGQDLIYAACSHKIKTSKHVTLGLAVKSLCSSKKVVNILAKYGHCCSYTVLQQLETDLAYATVNSDSVCPEDILQRPDLNTGVAFDNYDRFIETTNGKDTLHDTVGIILQDKLQIANPMSVISQTTCEEENTTLRQTAHDHALESPITQAPSSQTRKARKRAFTEISFDMRPFTKKLKVATWNNLDISAVNQVPENLKTVKLLDVAWMMSHLFKIADVPMWVGYHSQIIIDSSPVQKISYLTPINDSPTNHSTVLQTLELSQKIAKECQAPYIQVTYDLAIARISYCIQTQESPKFDNIFIHMGAFHIEMAFFKAIGTFIEDCGLTHIMTECDLIADGSVAGFIAGKNYNRCRRLHSLMAITLQQLHFETFLENKNITIENSVIKYLAMFMQQKDTFPQVQHTETEKVLGDYDQYTADTLEGKYGKTAQYYAMYIDLINLYHVFIRSIRIGDLDLYLYALGKIVCLFFTYNQPNYSRWLVYYINQLQHLEDTHPGLRAKVEKGSFGIRRTSKPFSRIPVDLTLEQTINGEAARRLTGITNLSSSTSARQRWARNHGGRTRIISYVLARAGLSNDQQDIASDLKPDRMKKNRKQMDAFLQSVQQTANPFSHSLERDQLYNISTGQATTPEIATSLLNAMSSGEFLRDQFISECNMDFSRFHKSIKKNSVKTFASSKKKKSIKIGQKIHEVKLQRDLFGRLLALSLDKNLDLDKVLCFPITPVPLSLCHIDGSMNKTVKSVLIQELEKKVEEMDQPPQQLDFLIVDGFFFFNTFKQVPRSFGDLSKRILQSLVNNSATHIAIIFDRYFTPSIKDCEHTLRGTIDDKDFHITGPQQTRTADFGKELKNIKFKEALVKFLIDNWADPEMASIIGNKTIYLNHDLCYVYSVTDNEVTRKIDYDLSCEDHEEADTKIVFFACQIKEDATVTVRTSDTDIIVIMLANMEHLQASVQIWFDLGVGNSRRYIDMYALFNKLGLLASQALPALHAFTGCDFNPALYKRGKKKPLDIMMGSETFLKAFANLGSETYTIDEIFLTMESFVCHLYGLKKLADVNRARIEIFNKTYKVIDITQPFSLNVRNYDACNLPPCQSELRQHLLRTKYIACLWRNSHYRVVSEMSPTDFGWKNVEGKFEMTWFTGNQLPEAYEDIVVTPDIFGNTSDSDMQDDDDNDQSDLNFQYEDDSSDNED